MKVTKNESGITLIAGVLLAVIVGIIAFASYRVYDLNNQKQDESYGTPQKAEPKKEEQKSDIPEGFVEYKNEELGFKFAYPEEWIVKETRTPKENSSPNTSDLPKIELISEDFQEDDQAVAYGGTKSGAYFEFKVQRSKTKPEKPLNSQFIKNYQERKIDGVEASDYYWSYEGPAYQYLEFYKDGYKISFAYRYKGSEDNPYDIKSEYDQRYLSIRDQIIQTIKFL